MNLSEETRAAVLVAEAAEVGIVEDTAVETVVDTTTIIKHCLVCYESLETTVTLTPCHHNEICATCHLRLRWLHHDKKCPICKQDNEQIIVDYTHNAHEKITTHGGGGGGFAAYNIWGNDLGADFVYLESVGVFFPRDYYNSIIQPLFGHHCTLPNCGYAGMNSNNNGSNIKNEKKDDTSNENKAASTPAVRALQNHLRTKHRLALCQLCIDHERDFISKLPRFTPHQLKQHLTKGDGPDSAFRGHPLCEFCRPTRFYDVQALHVHLNKQHYKCHVCEQSLGLHNQFFKNYQSLERHFDNQHFLCRDVQCLQARFVVFGNELDLRHHERQVHGGTSREGGSTKISLEFRVRRPNQEGSSSSNNQEVPSDADFQYNLDGQAFVPQELPQNQRGGGGGGGSGGGGASSSSGSGDYLTLHPLHVQRTAELRQQAAALRQAAAAAQGESAAGDGNLAAIAGGGAAFPSLAESNTTLSEQQQQQNQFRVGWTSGSTTMQRVGVKKNVGAVTEESFPSLGGGGSNNAASASTKKLTAKAQRSFAAMQNSANSAPVTTTSTPSSNWGGGGAATVAAAASASSRPAQSSAFLQASAPVRNNNKANLSADNFPSLGPAPRQTGPSGKPRQTYAAAEALARRHQLQQQQQPEPFITRKSAASSQQTAPAQAKPAPAPQINSNYDFPAPSRTIPAFTAAASSSEVTIEEMKATMGKQKYKELKRLTVEFAQGNLDPTPYVDMSAALFDDGYSDTKFWKFLPCLLSSCPNQRHAQQASAYMDKLSKLRNGALNAEQQQSSQMSAAAIAAAAGPSLAATANRSSGGGKWASVPARVVTPQSTAATAAAVPSYGAPLSYATRTTAAAMPAASKAKSTKSAWGSSGSSPSTVARAKAPPGSVAVAAAAAASSNQGGSATKFMAKEQKQQKQQQHHAQQQSATATVGGGGKNKKNKSKKKNELRELAFGK